MTAMTGADRGELVRAFESARASDDVEAMAAAALGIVGERRFGAPPAPPGSLHAASPRAPRALRGPSRGGRGGPRTARGLGPARAWAYAGEPDRAAPFA